jgi:cytosine/adenosine deaminase-related metal-dependent hydrolase
MRLFRARWVLPIAAPPRRDAWVLVEDDVVVDVGVDEIPSDTARERIEVTDLGPAAILPGLVNAHTHLELSWMRDRVPPAGTMPAWASSLLALRRTVSHDPPEPIADAVREVRAAGTALLGDVTNTLAACDLLAESRVGGAAIFRELVGFSAPDPDRLVAETQAQLSRLPSVDKLRSSIVPHAPYSVSPALFRAIAAVAGAAAISLHLGESEEEVAFLRNGTGAWRDLLGRLGAWTDTWQPPGCGPVEYVERLGLLTEHLLAVHGTQLNDGELARLAGAGATIVTCPRSNRWTGAGTPPVERFYASGVRVAIGTDSLASVEDLNIFSELAALRRIAPGIPAARLLESATVDGAAALGFGSQFGTIEPGKRAELIAVRVPPSIGDVEEYLLTGIEPGDVSWLDE